MALMSLLIMEESAQERLATFMAETRLGIQNLTQGVIDMKADSRELRQKVDANAKAADDFKAEMIQFKVEMKTRLAIYASILVFVGPMIFALIVQYMKPK